MHINDLDLNLLRLFDAIYRTRQVSRAAEQLEMTQPAASQALTRLRLLLGDPLFVRAAGGVQPTPRADRLADTVRQALELLVGALNDASAFAPASARKLFRVHMSDIGEGRFLPALMAYLHQNAPGVRLETLPVPRNDIAAWLDAGRIDFAFGFLPSVKDTQSVELLHDRYVVLLRAGHPFAQRCASGTALLDDLAQLEFVAVRTHAHTLRILELLQLEDRLRLTTEHFMVLPAIVKATNLAVVMPYNIACMFTAQPGYTIIEAPFALRDFTVSLHWSRRFASDPGNRWMRGVMETLFMNDGLQQPLPT